MTLCLAIRHKEGVLVGVDSSSVDGNGALPEKVKKLYTRPTGAFVGCGNLYEVSKYGGFWTSEGTRGLLAYLRIVHAEDFSCIVVEGKTIRLIDEHGTVAYPKQKYTAIGSGEDLARGYLTAAYRCGNIEDVPDRETAQNLAKLCFRDCARFDHQIRSPFRMVNV